MRHLVIPKLFVRQTNDKIVKKKKKNCILCFEKQKVELKYSIYIYILLNKTNNRNNNDKFKLN